MNEALREFVQAATLQHAGAARVVIPGVSAMGAAAGVCGVYLLLRRRALLGDSISHAALPGVCVAFLLAGAVGLDPRSLPLLVLGAGVAGLLSVACVRGLERTPHIRRDGAIGATLAVFFAVGVVLLSVIQRLPGGNQAGIGRFIFGQASAMRTGDAWAMLGAAVLVAACAAAFARPLRAVCFDEPFARAVGLRAGLVDALALTAVGVVVAMGLQAAGALLVVAMLIVPATSARFWTDRFGALLALAGAIGAASAWLGAAWSASFPDTPTGPAIVLAGAACFVVSALLAPRRGIVADAVRRARARRAILAMTALPEESPR